MAGRGNNLHEVKDSSGISFLVSMPVKFRKNVWIKRGDFVIVTHIEAGDKVEQDLPSIKDNKAGRKIAAALAALNSGR